MAIDRVDVRANQSVASGNSSYPRSIGYIRFTMELKIEKGVGTDGTLTQPGAAYPSRRKFKIRLSDSLMTYDNFNEPTFSDTALQEQETTNKRGFLE